MHVNYIDWHVHPFRADRWMAIWEPALTRALGFGAQACYLTRSEDDPLHFRQTSIWKDRADFERYWYSDDLAAMREAALSYYGKPLLPTWSVLIAEGESGAAADAADAA